VPQSRVRLMRLGVVVVVVSRVFRDTSCQGLPYTAVVRGEALSIGPDYGPSLCRKAGYLP
jgi:hypothetical protein